MFQNCPKLRKAITLQKKIIVILRSLVTWLHNDEKLIIKCRRKIRKILSHELIVTRKFGVKSRKNRQLRCTMHPCTENSEDIFPQRREHQWSVSAWFLLVAACDNCSSTHNRQAPGPGPRAASWTNRPPPQRYKTIASIRVVISGLAGPRWAGWAALGRAGPRWAPCGPHLFLLPSRCLGRRASLMRYHRADEF